MIDPNSFVVYGVAWMLVGMAILFIIDYFRNFPLDEKVERVIQAIWAVLGYFLIGNLESLESLWPGMPIVLPQILLAILLFGGMLGFQPGAMFRFVVGLFRRKSRKYPSPLRRK